MEAGKRTNAGVYRMKVTLRHVKPPVWRRIEVSGDIKLGGLHEVLQIVMGWTDSHLHGFRIGRESYAMSNPNFPGDFKNGRTARLNKIAGEGEVLVYDYDFGDGWEHGLKIEKILPQEQGVHYPRCTKGERACSLEDCGGPWGYAELLRTIRNPKHEEHEELLEWLGGDFDPEYFGVNEVNEALTGG
jgi:hypothetical protein